MPHKTRNLVVLPLAAVPSVDSQIILAARGRLRRALKEGYENVYDRFNRDDVFATSLTGEGCTAFDAAQEDLYASLQLPAPSRSAKQRSKGKSVVSDLDRQDRVDLAKLAYIRCGVDNLHTCFKQGLDENFLISYRREFLSLRQFAAVIGNSRDEIRIQGFIPTGGRIWRYSFYPHSSWRHDGHLQDFERICGAE